MASFHSLKTLFVVALALAFFVQVTLGDIACENLNEESCAFAISSTGKRCVLEKHLRRSGEEVYTCRTSEIEADKLRDWIETAECIESCGVDRNALGISSDALLESRFTNKLCSSACYKHCPNIIDLYFNLAAGEGVYLPKLCAEQKENGRREMAEIRSSGFVSPAPESEVKPLDFMIAPAMPPL
ncbi:hypothetical protein HAX54_036068 [Datura stramonium]|uniref:PAR1 protein n=1 Tax=Datura stramonium TaxID=4076 RepID=A0ABS8SG27_DATST|nr:hypothetical protein [Datura stramonium]